MRRGAVNDTFSASKDPKNDKKPVRIELYDTSLRDGAQSEGVSFSLNDKLAVTYRLDDLGIDYIEGGYPALQELDDIFRTCDLNEIKDHIKSLFEEKKIKLILNAFQRKNRTWRPFALLV